MEVLDKLFGSAAKVKIMRLFLQNPSGFFTLAEIAKRTRTSPRLARRETENLKSAGLLVSKIKGKSRVFYLNRVFSLLQPLSYLLKNNLLAKKRELIKKFTRCGRINLLAAAGVFLADEDGRVDLLFVGDNLKKPLVERAVRDLEAEMGNELRYAVLDTDDFVYRLSASDKFVRDVFDYPHQVIIDRIGLK